MYFHAGQAVYVNHLTLKVRQLPVMKEFYQKIVGLHVLKEDEQAVTFTSGDTDPLLTLIQDDNFTSADERTTGLYHFALLLPSREDLAAFLRHLVKNNIEIGAADHLVSEALYIDDPEGNGIEIYADRPSEEWDWQDEQVKMTTDPLDGDALIKLSEDLPEWNRTPRATLLGHIHLHVNDLAASEEFYTKGLGFSVVTRYGDQALFISTEKYHHHIGLNTWNGVKARSLDKNETGLADYSILYPNAQMHEFMLSKLTAMNVELHNDERGTFVYDPASIKVYLAFK